MKHLTANRLLCLLLSLVMVIGILPMSAFAEDAPAAPPTSDTADTVEPAPTGEPESAEDSAPVPTAMSLEPKDAGPSVLSAPTILNQIRINGLTVPAEGGKPVKTYTVPAGQGYKVAEDALNPDIRWYDDTFNKFVPESDVENGTYSFLKGHQYRAVITLDVTDPKLFQFDTTQGELILDGVSSKDAAASFSIREWRLDGPSLILLWIEFDRIGSIDDLPFHNLTTVGCNCYNFSDNKARAGEKVLITANTPAEGMVFTGFTVQPDTLSLDLGTVNELLCSFIMPDEDVTITANYKPAVTAVDITDFAYPQVGQVPDNAITVPADAEYKVYDGHLESSEFPQYVTWFDKSAEAWVAPQGVCAGTYKFLANRIYTAQFIMELKDTSTAVWADKEDLKITLNGISPETSGNDFRIADISVNNDPGVRKCFITVNFPNLYKDMRPVYVINGIPDKLAAKPGETVKITANPAPESHEFNYWEIERGTVKLNNSHAAVTTFIMPDEEFVQFRAHYRQKKLTLTIDPNGGTTGCDFMKTLNIPSGNILNVTPPPASFIYAPAGKIFAGVEVKGKVYDAGESFPVNEDMTLKFIWADKGTLPALVPIEVDWNGGDGPTKFDTVREGSKWTFPALEEGENYYPAKGMMLDGFELNGHLYHAEDVIQISGPTLLKAVWTPLADDMCLVAFAPNGAVQNPWAHPYRHVKKGAELILPSGIHDDFIPPDQCKFGGYLHDGTHYDPYDTVTVTGDMVFQLEWTPITKDENTVRVDFDVNGGTPFTETWKLYKKGTSIWLGFFPSNVLAPPVGKFLCGFEIDGKEYGLDTDYIVNKDTVIKLLWDEKPHDLSELPPMLGLDLNGGTFSVSLPDPFAVPTRYNFPIDLNQLASSLITPPADKHLAGFEIEDVQYDIDDIYTINNSVWIKFLWADDEAPDPEKPDPEKPDPEKPDPEKPNPEKPDPEKPDPEKPDPEKPNPEKPDPEKPDPEKPDPKPDPKPGTPEQKPAEKPQPAPAGPKTGDNTHLALWGVLCAVALGGSLVLIKKKIR